MKQLLLTILLTLTLSADWNQSKLLPSGNLEQMCKHQINIAKRIKETTNCSASDKQMLEEYIQLVKHYCSQLAGCANCYKDN